jgi:hypothetical protein
MQLLNEKTLSISQQLLLEEERFNEALQQDREFDILKNILQNIKKLRNQLEAEEKTVEGKTS